jgi:hypothetical protein
MGDMSSTQEKQLTFFGAIRVIWTMYSIAWSILVAFAMASWRGGVIVSTRVTEPQNGSAAIVNAKRAVTVTMGGVTVTFKVERVT